MELLRRFFVKKNINYDTSNPHICTLGRLHSCISVPSTIDRSKRRV